jgi:hypothetical protein
MSLLPVAIAILALGEGASPPAPLRCLARYYAVTAELREGKWFGVLADGTAIPYDDGRKKSPEERLQDPDIKDVFAQRYRKGAIAAVSREDEDPGRARLEKVFLATYGKSERQVDVIEVLLLGQSLRVHRKVAPAFQRVFARLAKSVEKDPALRPFLTRLGGTFTWRMIAGTNRPSPHSFGVSIDLNVALSHYWRWQSPPSPIRWTNKIPQVIVDAFEAEGFIWGGRWYHYDTMHFEYRPELLDEGCYEK